MTTVHEYVTLSPAQRDRVCSAVRDVAVGSNERYADLLAAEAVLTARAVYPDTHRLVFRLGEDITATTATLVAAYDLDGTPLWRVDPDGQCRDGEWRDESRVSDLLAAAVDWYDGHFPCTAGAARGGRPVSPVPIPTNVGDMGWPVQSARSASRPRPKAARRSSWLSSTAAKARRVTGSRCWRCMCGPIGSWPSRACTT